MKHVTFQMTYDNKSVEIWSEIEDLTVFLSEATHDSNQILQCIMGILYKGR